MPNEKFYIGDHDHFLSVKAGLIIVNWNAVKGCRHIAKTGIRIKTEELVIVRLRHVELAIKRLLQSTLIAMRKSAF
jgi:hypothetical protein